MDAAAPLLARNGIAKTTVRMIADEIGLLSGSLYHYFDSKDAIVNAIVGEYLEVLVDRYGREVTPVSDAQAKFHALVSVSLEVCHSFSSASEIYQGNRHFFADSRGYAEIRDLASEVQKVWFDTIDSGVAAGAFRGDVDAGVFYRFARDAVFLSTRWFVPSEDRTLADLARDTVEIMISGFRQPAS